MTYLRIVALVMLAAVPAVSAQQQLPEASSVRTGVRSYRPAVAGVHGLVTTAGKPLATMAGVRMLLAGGNAVYAALAVLATLNVVEPEMSGAGGNGFMLVYERKSGKIHSLSMTGAAPKGLRPEKMTARDLSTGVHAGPVPGLFGGWVAALTRFGTRSLSDCLAAALDYAENGHPIDPTVVRSIESRRADLTRFPTSARIFLPGGNLPQPGSTFVLRDLAATFRKVTDAEKTALAAGKSRADALAAAHDRFYKGDIAREIVRFMQENGGTMGAEDLAAYRAVWTEPLQSRYRGYDVYSTPPTSRGGLEVLMQLNLVEGYDLGKLGHNSADAIHLQAEAIKVAKADVYRYVADGNFARVPVAGLLAKDYAARRRRLIDAGRAIAYPDAGQPADAPARAGAAPVSPRFPEDAVEGHTTSFSVVDQAGNVVVCTPTLGSGFGTALVVGDTGLFFNNGLRIGATSPYADSVNYVRGGQIPLLNNSPVLVFREGKFVLALGSPGGETIGQTQFQVLVNVLDFGLPIQEAIEASRFSLDASPNFYKPGARVVMQLEGGASPEAVARLRQMGHEVSLRPRFGGIGNMQGIHVDLATGAMTAGADPRRTGYAIGW
jgi:gamma-glutamyltranspeptidase/glutathione hydrolase